jgi:hypothetical protein
MLAMENVTTSMFPLTSVNPLSDQFRARMVAFNMPGTHGSGTQWMTSAIGRSTLATISWAMTHWGSSFSGGAPSVESLAEAFASIHVDSPVQYDKKGNVKADDLDDAKGFAAKVTHAFKGVGRKDTLSKELAKVASNQQRRIDFRDSRTSSTSSTPAASGQRFRHSMRGSPTTSPTNPRSTPNSTGSRPTSRASRRRCATWA